MVDSPKIIQKGWKFVFFSKVMKIITFAPNLNSWPVIHGGQFKNHPKKTKHRKTIF